MPRSLSENRKRRVDKTFALDIRGLHGCNFFDSEPGQLASLEWTVGPRQATSAWVSLERDCQGSYLRIAPSLSDFLRRNARQWGLSIRIVPTPCRFGGERWWFLCPHTRNGNPCGRRCRILYVPTASATLGCRQCHDLTYRCRQLHRDWLYERVEKPLLDFERGEQRIKEAQSLDDLTEALTRVRRAEERLVGFTDWLRQKFPVDDARE